ncbi:MAG: NapC/NirT family cytochrome c [Rhodospirillales bacterium]|nr:NapC/NirT family cytochrome c [Rhodospirillales bacterium]MCW8862285.1 NapC/NirT family cytochrome c [Rhodospirillales bacterium]MCW8952806.1 NapC/NirT family cytochrome c [Rhodospirillales bacterium]MCW8970249.1 NapC/NirT family cytochrome c [Rhodospirillales bacterium]MCW9001849.1 NapC/NirT family cytochrome c [Rhodospirillales bacterium]
MSEETKPQEPQPGTVGALIRMLRRPSAKYSVGGLILAGIIAGIILWGGFNTAMEMTNTESFCISCHEMKDNVYEEYKETIHYSNRTGVRATCPDCHVPKEWTYKVMRKIQASNELLHKALGTIDTREKFEAERMTMASRVWTTMIKSDSRECRNCHSFDYMDMTKQERRSKKRHARAQEKGQTCIACHKGIAHKLPEGTEEWEDAWKEAHKDKSGE